MDLASAHSLAIPPMLGTVAFLALLALYGWRYRQVPGASLSAVWAPLIAARGIVSGLMPAL